MPYLDVDQGTPGGQNPAAPGLIRIGRGVPGLGDAVTIDSTTGAIVSNGPVQSGASGFAVAQTVTGVSVATALIPGYTLPAGSLAAGQIFEFEAWGVITTTLAAQTVDLQLLFGGLGGTVVLDMGAQQPNSGGTLTNAAWGIRGTLLAIDGTHTTAVGWDFFNFFPSGSNQKSSTVVSNASAAQLVLAVTPSASAVSITANGGYIRRVQ